MNGTFVNKNQEAYDKVKNHLLTQMKRSTDGVVCLYRGKNGLKCAIGVLIPDEFYNCLMEGLTPDNDYFVFWYDQCGIWEGYDSTFLTELQFIHDYVDPLEWEQKLKYLAIKRGLIP